LCDQTRLKKKPTDSLRNIKDFDITASLFLCRFKTFSCAAVEVKNEPVLGFKEGSKERSELEKVKHTHTHTDLDVLTH